MPWIYAAQGLTMALAWILIDNCERGSGVDEAKARQMILDEISQVMGRIENQS